VLSIGLCELPMPSVICAMLVPRSPAAATRERFDAPENLPRATACQVAAPIRNDGARRCDDAVVPSVNPGARYGSDGARSRQNPGFATDTRDGTSDATFSFARNGESGIERGSRGRNAGRRRVPMYNIFYIIGVVVVVLAILGYFGFR
jgi:hypothetical protein